MNDGDVAARTGDGAAARVRTAVRVVVVSALVGLAISTIEPTLDATFENVVYAICIGLSVYAFIETLDALRLPWIGRSLAIRAAVAIPPGFFVGVNVASLLRGRPAGLAAFEHVAPIAAVVTVVTSAGFTYFLWSRQRLAEAAAANAHALRTTAEARLKLLQTQIEPHMLFNTLANLRTLIDVDPARAQTMVDELIVYLRATLAASRDPLVPLAAEFAQLRAYLELMTVRMAHRLRYVLDLPDALAASTIPPMLLQPLVENAIKHGLEPAIAGGTVRVVVRGDGARLSIEVGDDGVGDASRGGDGALRRPPGSGFGLEHVRERLATVYGTAATMTAAAGPAGGFVVRLALPNAVTTRPFDADGAAPTAFAPTCGEAAR